MQQDLGPHHFAVAGLGTHAPSRRDVRDEQKSPRVLSGRTHLWITIVHFDSGNVTVNGDLHIDGLAAVEDRVRREFACDQHDIFAATIDRELTPQLMTQLHRSAQRMIKPCTKKPDHQTFPTADLPQVNLYGTVALAEGRAGR